MNDPHPEVGTTTLDLYKLAVEMADRISSRRASANSFFLTVQTTFVAVLGIATPTLYHAPWWTALAVSLAGIILSGSWWLQLRSYRDLNRAKFNVINSIESALPVQLFTAEWAFLASQTSRKRSGRYRELGSFERVIPIIFAALYVLLFAGRAAK
jgi:hypothetical protein